MDREGLLGDLKALHHGRGLRRAGVRGWLGPALLEARDELRRVLLARVHFVDAPAQDFGEARPLRRRTARRLSELTGRLGLQRTDLRQYLLDREVAHDMASLVGS